MGTESSRAWKVMEKEKSSKLSISLCWKAGILSFFSIVALLNIQVVKGHLWLPMFLNLTITVYSSLKINRNMLSSRKVRKKYMYSITNMWFYYQAADMAQAAL